MRLGLFLCFCIILHHHAKKAPKVGLEVSAASHRHFHLQKTQGGEQIWEGGKKAIILEEGMCTFAGARRVLRQCIIFMVICT